MRKRSYKKNDNNKNEDDGILTIKRKHLIKYELLKYFWIYVVFILIGDATKSSLGLIGSVLILLIIIGFLLFWNKRISKATTCKFSEEKVEYKCKFWIIDRQREILYKDLDSINKEQTFLQKMFNLGNIYIYAKKGNLLTTGIEIRNVHNFKETYERIDELIEEKKK